MESRGTSSSSGGPANLAAELNPGDPQNEAEDGNPDLEENMGAVIETEGFVENIVNDVEERVSWASTQGNDFQEAKRKRRESGEGYVGTQQALVTDADALSCPICMEPCTSDGSHQISCLPCGHLFGQSCIKKWIQQGVKKIGKCPHCNKKCKVSEIRILFGARIAVADGEMQQELSLLRAENEKLKSEELRLLRAENEKLKSENKKLVDERHQRKNKKLVDERQQRKLGNLQGPGVGNNSAANLQMPSTATASQQQMPCSEKYTKVWEGILQAQRQGKPVPICRLEAYRNMSSPEILAADWPISMQIIRLISLEHITSKHYQGKAEFLIFRTLTQHGFLVKLAEKKLSAVIQLPNQTLLLSSADRPGRMIGMLFPGDIFVFKLQLPNQPHLQQQQQQQQQQPQGMPSGIGQAFAQSQLPNQTRPQLMSQSQF